VSSRPKELHRSFWSSKWLMRLFRAIVEPTANFVTVGVADLFHRCGIRAKPVSDDALRLATFLHHALQKLERCGLVPLRRDHGFQNLAFVIDSPPKIAALAVDHPNAHATGGSGADAQPASFGSLPGTSGQTGSTKKGWSHG
jgi:hypothetical protein